MPESVNIKALFSLYEVVKDKYLPRIKQELGEFGRCRQVEVPILEVIPASTEPFTDEFKESLSYYHIPTHAIRFNMLTLDGVDEAILQDHLVSHLVTAFDTVVYQNSCDELKWGHFEPYNLYASKVENTPEEQTWVKWLNRVSHPFTFMNEYVVHKVMGDCDDVAVIDKWTLWLKRDGGVCEEHIVGINTGSDVQLEDTFWYVTSPIFYGWTSQELISMASIRKMAHGVVPDNWIPVEKGKERGWVYEGKQFCIPKWCHTYDDIFALFARVELAIDNWAVQYQEMNCG